MRAHRQRNLSRHQKIFLQKAPFTQRLPPLWGGTIFGQVFGRGGMTKFSKWKVPLPGGHFRMPAPTATDAYRKGRTLSANARSRRRGVLNPGSQTSRLESRRPRFSRNGTLWNVRRSLQLDPRELDHLAPLFGFVGNELGEIGRRPCPLDPSLIVELLFQIWIGKPCVHRLVYAIDDVCGRVSRRADAVPRTDLITCNKLGDGRQARFRGCAHRAGDRKPARLAGPDVPDRGGKRREQNLDLPTEKDATPWGGAPVWH